MTRVRASALGLLGGVVAGLRLLSASERRRMSALTVAAILPFINVVIQPGAVRTNGGVHRLYEWSGAANESDFVYLMGAVVLVAVLVSALAGWALLYAQNRRRGNGAGRASGGRRIGRRLAVHPPRGDRLHVSGCRGAGIA